MIYEVQDAPTARSRSSTIPSKLPPANQIDELREPIIIANILVPPDHVGGVLQLCSEKRGVQKKMLFLGTQVSLQYELPLAEVVLDFFDRLKSHQPRLRLVRLRVQPFPGRAAGRSSTS